MSATVPYRRALDGLEAILATVPAGRWDAPSPCAQWSVRDLAGHVIWGQEQLRCWVTGEEYTGPPGGPGTPHPRHVAGADPVAAWRRVRTACTDSLTDDALARSITLPGLGERPVSAIVTIVANDALIHTWDIGHALGRDVQLPTDLVAESLAWARDNVIRMPGFFGPELAPPSDVDEQTRWLAFLGRAAWQPVTAAA
jgi:uncharacterized protein (TIGR03086 family)